MRAIVPSVKVTNKCRRMSETLRADGFSALPEEVPSDKARHWKGTLRGCGECVNKKSATEIGQEAVTQKKVVRAAQARH